MRDPVEFVALIQALAGHLETHILKVVENGRVLFRGTKEQCQWVKEGFDQDMYEGHPDAVGKTSIEEVV